MTRDIEYLQYHSRYLSQKRGILHPNWHSPEMNTADLNLPAIFCI
jgi:hypothetical protein